MALGVEGGVAEPSSGSMKLMFFRPRLVPMMWFLSVWR